MSRACTPVLVGVTSSVSEIWLPFKNGQISLSGHYSPWSWKNSINRNRLKKFMQVGIDVTCMHTNFGGWSLSSFGDIAILKKQPKFHYGPWTIMVVEKFNCLESAQKLVCMHILSTSTCMNYL